MRRDDEMHKNDSMNLPIFSQDILLYKESAPMVCFKSNSIRFMIAFASLFLLALPHQEALRLLAVKAPMVGRRPRVGRRGTLR
eukprot:SAG31_NODE_407_length_16049_cov_46.312915_10_plen_83_part_00